LVITHVIPGQARDDVDSCYFRRGLYIY